MHPADMAHVDQQKARVRDQAIAEARFEATARWWCAFGLIVAFLMGAYSMGAALEFVPAMPGSALNPR